MSNITVIHPSRGRIEQALETSFNWLDKSADDVQYLVSVDSDDPQLEEYKENFEGLIISHNRSVVDAVNNAAKFATGDIIVVVSDDFDCPQDWDELILQAFHDHPAYDNSMPWAMKTDDGAQPWIITLPIVSRGWYETFGYIYQPDYRHMFCDTDMTTVAYMMACKIDARHLKFPHNHYTTGKTDKDELNARNDSTMDQGAAVYLERFVNDFHLPHGWIKQRINHKHKEQADIVSWLVRSGVRNV